MLRAVFSWVYVEFFFDLVLGDGLGVLSGIYAFRGVWFYGFGVWGCVFLNRQARIAFKSLLLRIACAFVSTLR